MTYRDLSICVSTHLVLLETKIMAIFREIQDHRVFKVPNIKKNNVHHLNDLKYQNSNITGWKQCLIEIYSSEPFPL